MSNKQIIFNTIAFVKDTLQNAEGGHDWFHIERVYNNSLLIAKTENVNELIIALGIARCFNYGGFKNRKIFDPSILPNMKMTKEEYKTSSSPTINHFYEKLLLLKDRMNTKTGKRIALARHQFMEQYLEQFYSEWDGKR